VSKKPADQRRCPGEKYAITDAVCRGRIARHFPKCKECKWREGVAPEVQAAAEPEIDLDAVGHNIDQVRAKTGVEIIPCVKTNAYGHGLVPVVAYMMRKGMGRVLVAKLWEALQIRDAGLSCGVVNMDPLYSENQFETVVEKDITQTIYQKEAAERLSAASKRMG
jgi:alanine racemase